MKVPIQTSEIFKILSKGQFINSNSSNKNISDLYKVIEDEENFENLFDYFININFILEKGEEYFYFSRPENKAELETKLEASFRWIDIIDFFKTYNNSFSAGFRFSPSEILVRIKTDAELETKLVGLKKHTDKEKHNEILEKILKKFHHPLLFFVVGLWSWLADKLYFILSYEAGFYKPTLLKVHPPFCRITAYATMPD